MLKIAAPDDIDLVHDALIRWYQGDDVTLCFDRAQPPHPSRNQLAGHVNADDEDLILYYSDGWLTAVLLTAPLGNLPAMWGRPGSLDEFLLSDELLDWMTETYGGVTAKVRADYIEEFVGKYMTADNKDLFGDFDLSQYGDQEITLVGYRDADGNRANRIE